MSLFKNIKKNFNWRNSFGLAPAIVLNAYFDKNRNDKLNKAYIADSDNLLANARGDTKRDRFGSDAGTVFAYPIDIDPKQDHVELSQFMYRRPGSDWGAKNAAWDRMNASAPGASTRGMKHQGTIVLPMPRKVSDSNAAEWGDSEMTSDELVKAQMAGVGLGMRQSGRDQAQERASQGQGAGTDEGGFGDASKGRSGNFNQYMGGRLLQWRARRAAKNIGGTVTDDALLARARGQVMNPNAELLFQGPVLRQFKFNWLMIARSKKEGDMIRKIIRKLKIGAAPKFNNTALIETPDIWHIKYKRGGQELKTANRFEQLALVGMTVDYAPDNYWTTYQDSQPIAVKIDLDFKELRPIWRNHQEEFAPQDSVGY